jgi:hypothetical protein
MGIMTRSNQVLCGPSSERGILFFGRTVGPESSSRRRGECEVDDYEAARKIK